MAFKITRSLLRRPQPDATSQPNPAATHVLTDNDPKPPVGHHRSDAQHPAAEQRSAKRITAAVMRSVAEQLGNTPAVARGSYVDPRVVTAYDRGQTIAAARLRAGRVRRPDAAQAIVERATRALIRRVAKGGSTSAPALAKTA